MPIKIAHKLFPYLSMSCPSKGLEKWLKRRRGKVMEINKHAKGKKKGDGYYKRKRKKTREKTEKETERNTQTKQENKRKES